MENETQTAVVRRFRVLKGSHVQGKKTYTEGKIVKSDRDLAALFVNKFVEVGKPEDKEAAAVVDKAKTSDVSRGQRERDETEAEAEAPAPKMVSSSTSRRRNREE